ncbi:Tetratricopeptide TPR_1 repeat-containing protein [Isosphaera pallida ATCC 43644]|uniref:Tetratricopeptide TPR_1 repeat-containing protein n=1 Tax=Isosphaera pallida (strain ATCC 43644 / DSM 9630 / IS1B) TaxID=575540 RepID=E8QYH4_ISOPI|nr:tetratricopeptide repeat protein [Isosphaera pallida]ADV64157.1 Tetratricopeptide TPR_1 repeat-containing protein [Isosphaera pallida ATCC 43644]
MEPEREPTTPSWPRSQAESSGTPSPRLESQGSPDIEEPRATEPTGPAETTAQAWYDRGVAAYEAGRWEEAVEALTKALELHDASRTDPRDEAVTRHHLGLALEALGRTEEAIEEYRAAAAALETARQALDPKSDSSNARRLTAELANALGTLAGALDPSDPSEAIELNRRAVGLLDEVIAGANEDDPALSCETRATRASLLSSLGYLLRETGRSDEAVRVFGEAVTAYRDLIAQGRLDLRADEAIAWSNYIFTLEELQRIEEALAPASAAVKLFAERVARGAWEHRLDQARALGRAARVLDRMGRPDEAAVEYPKALAVLENLVASAPASACQPDEAREELAALHYQYGGVLDSLGHYRDALVHYRAAVADYQALVKAGRSDLRAELANAHTNLGSVLGTQGRLEDAVPHFLEAVALDGALAQEGRRERMAELIDAQVNLGLAYQAMGRPRDAAARYEKAVEGHDLLDPALYLARAGDHAQTLARLGLILEELGCRNEALSRFEQARDLLAGLLADGHDEWQSDHAMILSHIGRNLVALGRPEEAEVILNQALRLLEELTELPESDPDLRAEVARTRITLGHALRGLGRDHQAREQYRQADHDLVQLLANEKRDEHQAMRDRLVIHLRLVEEPQAVGS